MLLWIEKVRFSIYLLYSGKSVLVSNLELLFQASSITCFCTFLSWWYLLKNVPPKHSQRPQNLKNVFPNSKTYVCVHSWHIHCLYTKEECVLCKCHRNKIFNIIYIFHPLNNFTTMSVFGFYYSIRGLLKVLYQKKRKEDECKGMLKSSLL